LSATRRSAEALWTSTPADKETDGPAVRCDVSPERATKFGQREVAVRLEQSKFKQRLLRLGKKCELTGETGLEVLDAAHVRAASRGGTSEAENGLLMRADLHRLYDAGQFWFGCDGSVRCHMTLPRNYAFLRGKRIDHAVLKRIAPNLVYQANAY
jgi:putative restriction endonuclease